MPGVHGHVIVVVVEPRVQAGRWALLVTALLQAASPAVIPFGGSADDPPVVPAGYTFAVWSVILAGCLAVAVLGWPARRASTALMRGIHVPLSAVQVLFVAWLLAATSSAVRLTVPIFATMLVLLLVALRRARSADAGEPTGRALRMAVPATLGVYAGWSTAAVFVNLATLLTQAGVRADGATGAVWQGALLVVAGATAVAVLRSLDAPLPYAATVVWAFVGVVVAASTAGVPGLAAVAGVGVVTVLAVTVSVRRRTAVPA